MADVAKLAGVSHQTVSRVINESSHVRDQTRERVLAAMQELGYRPNSVARALATGRTRTIGVVSFDTTLYGPASTLLGIEQSAHAQGYFVSIASVQALDAESIAGAVERLRVQGVDGIMVIAPQEAGVRALAHVAADVPLVAVEAGPDSAIPVVSVDQFAGAAAATRHLLELGHRRVWHIAGPGDWLEAQQRIAGWRATIESAGAPLPEPVLGDWSARSGYELGQRLVADPEVTAVFAANDQMALGVLRATHEAGRMVPGELSVVGFDDIPEAAFFSPPLTTIRQDLDAMGRRGVDLLLDAIHDGGGHATRVTLPPRLVVRTSTAPPP